MAVENPITPSEYIASQYYVLICTIPLICVALCLLNVKPFSERYPALSLFGMCSGVLVCVLQSLPFTCLWHAIWWELTVPLTYLPVVLQAYRFDLKCRFQEAILISHAEKRLETLLKLKQAVSYSYIARLFFMCLTPHVGVLIIYACFTDAFNATRTGYRTYGDEGFCVTPMFGFGVSTIVALYYVKVVLQLARKTRSCVDEFGIFNNIKRTVTFGAITASSFGIVLIACRPYVFYVVRVCIVGYVYIIMLPQMWEVWSAMKLSRIDVDSGIQLDTLLADPVGMASFRKQLVAEFSSENLDFWVDVNAMEKAAAADNGDDDRANATDTPRHIYDMYIPETAPLQVNISSKLLQRLKVEATAGRYSDKMFDEAKQEIFSLMEKDSFPRFKRGVFFKEYRMELLSSRSAGISSLSNLLSRGHRVRVHELSNSSSNSSAASDSPTMRIGKVVPGRPVPPPPTSRVTSASAASTTKTTSGGDTREEKENKEGQGQIREAAGVVIV